MKIDISMLDKNIKKNIPEFRVGDTVRVTFKYKEENIEKKQSFEGVVIAKRGHGVNSTFTVRKISYGVGVEQIFPLYSPAIESITVINKGKVRKAKLYYLREKVGKESKIEKMEEKNLANSEK